MTGNGGARNAGAEAAPSFPRSNRGTALVLLALTAILMLSIWTSDWAHEQVRDGFALGFFPLVALAAMALTLLVMLMDGEAKNATAGIAGLRGAHVVLALATVGFLGAMFLSISILGFIPAFWLLISGGALVLGMRPAWIAVFAGLVTALALRVLLMSLDVSVADGPLAIAFGS